MATYLPALSAGLVAAYARVCDAGVPGGGGAELWRAFDLSAFRTLCCVAWEEAAAWRALCADHVEAFTDDDT